jgi:hypothetical protein
MKDRLERSNAFIFSSNALSAPRIDSALLNSNNNQPTIISEIGTLIGSQGENKHIFGMIFEGFAREYYMQDLYAKVKLDLSNAIISKGYVISGCILIARGFYNEKLGRFAVEEF